MKLLVENMVSMIMMLIISLTFFGVVSMQFQIIYHHNLLYSHVEEVSANNLVYEERSGFTYERIDERCLKIGYIYSVEIPLFGEVIKDAVVYGVAR